MTNTLYENFAKSFLELEKMASRRNFRHFQQANFFMFILLISNQTVFSINLESICICEFFKKMKWHSPKLLVQFQPFEKLTRALISSKLNSKRYDYLCECENDTVYLVRSKRLKKYTIYVFPVMLMVYFFNTQKQLRKT